MKKFVLGWAGTALAFAAVAFAVGVFRNGSVVDHVVGGVLAVLAACGAWRCWNLASGHAKPRPPRTPTPARRPWER